MITEEIILSSSFRISKTERCEDFKVRILMANHARGSFKIPPNSYYSNFIAVALMGMHANTG